MAQHSQGVPDGRRAKPFRLAHLSDPHLGPMPKVGARALASKRVIGWLNWKLNRSGSMGADTLRALVTDLARTAPHHTVVSGDLTNLALPAEMERAAGWMASIGEPGDVTVIPGNHDAYVPGALASITEAWAANMAGERAGAQPYPFMRRVGPLALIGCSSAVATPPFIAAGRFGDGQAERLMALLGRAREEGRFRAVLIHHPPLRGAAPHRKRLFGIARFEEAIAEAGAELVLHGHTHLPTQGVLSERTGVPVIGVSAAGQSPGGHRPAARFNLFEIAPKPDVEHAWRCTQIERGVHAVDEGLEVREIARRTLDIPTR